MKGLEDQEDSIGYLNTILKYVFSVRRDITKDEYKKIAEKIETTYPEGSEVARPPLS